MQEHSRHHSGLLPILEKTQLTLLYSLVVVATLFFFPFTSNFFDEIRLLLVMSLSALSVVVWGVQAIVRRQVTLTIHPLLIPVLLYLAAFVVSSLLAPRHIVASLAGIPAITMSLLVLVVFATANLHHKISSRFLDVVLGIGVLLTATAGLQALGIGPSVLINMIFQTELPATFAFNLSSSPLVTLSLLLTVAFATALSVWKKPVQEQSLRLGGLAVVGVGIILHAWLMRPGGPFAPFVLPYQANWIMVTDTLKSLSSALWGVGPNSFSNAYAILRPVGLNATRSWNVVYEFGSNTPLTYLVTLGLFGFVAWVLLLIKSFMLVRTSSAKARPLGLLVLGSLLVQLLFPLNIALVAIQFVAMVFWLAALKEEDHPQIHDLALNLNTLSGRHQTASRGSNLLGYLAGLLSLGIAGVMIWYAQMLFRADVAFFRSLQAFAQGDGGTAYQRQQQSLVINPFNDRYHTAFAETSFAIAQAVSAQENLTDQQRQEITQLLQQSLQEARVATQLNPLSSANWTIMAALYSQLIGSIEGADQWAVAAYVQAIETNPNNPLLRIQLGNIFYQAEEYEQAAQLFAQAVQLKPDLPTAYYNLGKSLDQLGQTQQAVVAYQQLLSLLSPQDEAYADVEAELNTLLEKLEAEQPAEPAEVTETQPQEAELPAEIVEDAQLPVEEPNFQATDAAVISPAPTPETIPTQ